MKKDLKGMLEAKLQQNNSRHTTAGQEVEFAEGREYRLVPVASIAANPYQPRKVFPQDELAKLASSIAEIGLLEPILLRKAGDGYQIAAGERRWRAHKLLNKNTVEAIVTSISDSDMAVFALAENVDREDLSDYEISLAIRQVESLFPTKKKLAESLGLVREDMYRYFAFNELPDFMLADLEANPRLLSRSAANDLKKVLKDHKDSPYLGQVSQEAWGLLGAKELEQTKLADFIKRKIKEVANNIDTDVQMAQYFFRDGKKVGNISSTNHHFTIKLSAKLLNEAQEKRLKDFIEHMLADTAL